MRSVELRPLGRLAIVAGVAAAVLAVTVPIALGRETAGGPVTNYLTYVGGTAGKANPKLSPIVIGAINTQGGQVLVGPNWTKGAELAVKYVNTYLGGVQGHKLVLSECFTTSAEEDGTKCGQKFANDKRISVVVFGAVAVGNQSFYAALGGKKPIVSGVALLPVDAIAEERVRALRHQRLGARPVGHVREDEAAREDRRRDLPAGAGDRCRRQGREDEPRGRRDHDEARRLRPQLDRPDRTAHRGRSPDGRHRRPAEQRRRLRQRRQDAAAARRPGLEDRLQSALPERRGRGGPGRRPRAVGLRHRVDARRRQDGQGGRPLQQGDGDSSSRRSSRRTPG